jgi:uncharacterized membrane protein YcaP (DUF421 family)
MWAQRPMVGTVPSIDPIEGGEMFFDRWTNLVRVLLLGALAYAGLVAMLRVSGNRTLSKMNAFDLVVTVALGSTLATVLLSRDVVLAEGLLAFATLIVLQFVVTSLSVRVPMVRTLVTSEPTLLMHRGHFLHRQMRAARVTDHEVRAALRQAGIADPTTVAAVVLETDGSMSIVSGGSETTDLPSLGDVPYPADERA